MRRRGTFIEEEGINVQGEDDLCSGKGFDIGRIYK